MKKIYTILMILVALSISISAVSAEEWSWSSSSNNNGASIEVNNNEVKIQGLTFTVPEGYQENTNEQVSGENENGSLEGYKISSVTFEKDNQSIIIKVIYGDKQMTEDGYTPSENATSKEIANQKGYLTNHGDYLSFVYFKDGKFVQIDAPNEETLTPIVESSK